LFALALAFTFCITNPVAAEEEVQNNLLFKREALIKDGKRMEAIQFAKEIIAYGNEKSPQSKGRIYTEIFGAVGKIIWIYEGKDLATFEQGHKQFMADPAYRAILAKAAGLFIEGSIKDTLMARIP
jgi:hypothetical protein